MKDRRNRDARPVVCRDKGVAGGGAGVQLLFSCEPNAPLSYSGVLANKISLSAVFLARRSFLVSFLLSNLSARLLRANAITLTSKKLLCGRLTLWWTFAE